MSWTLATTAFFDRRARKFLAKHPDLRPWFAETLAQLGPTLFSPACACIPSAASYKAYRP